MSPPADLDGGAGSGTPTSGPAPPAAVTSSTAGHSKHYVFVDEYNRHKRLKVMRACDGCRKRKIRCDGALQNGPWPCGACVRLKLHCIPPSLDHDDDAVGASTLSADPAESGQTTFSTTSFSSSAHPRSGPDDLLSRGSNPPVWSAAAAPADATIPTPVSIDNNVDGNMYSSDLLQQQVGARLARTYSDDDYLSSTGSQQYSTAVRSEPRQQPPSSLPADVTDDNGEAEATVKELTDQLGDLRIDHLSVAPWITNQKKNAPDNPTQDDADVLLPASVTLNSTVHIPHEMMPSDARCMDYFGYFFSYIHPYVPVLSRKSFYDQWRNARETISPLLLEGIFACVARYLEEPMDVRRWLALAARHEESFKDVPRLSTIQALLLLTKAREFLPRRGYYYRSWMTVKYMTTMAMDLDLNEHYDKHRLGHSCTLDRNDCMVRTRIWQCLFMLELLVGAPQGRTDFSVEFETVDFNLPTVAPGMDQFEFITSRRNTYFAQNVRNIKLTNRMWQLMRWQKKDWALDPSFMRHNEDLVTFLASFPQDLQIKYEEDGSPPQLHGDHYLAYLHIYHHLIVIMHHRPQLQTLLEKRDPAWRGQLDVCLQAGMRMCQLQEALLNAFGIHGLQFMIRGIGFSIYCVLSCTILHLAAITSPDPDTNMTARNYFTRHMRVLEHCAPGAGLDMQTQIDALREAFSADTSKPFELKANLGMRSPSSDGHPSPPGLMKQQHAQQYLHQGNSAGTQMHAGSGWNEIPGPTAKIMASSPEYAGTNTYESGAGLDNRPAYPAAAANYSVPTNATFASPLDGVTSAPQNPYSLDGSGGSGQLAHEAQQPVWDPSAIFSHWNAAFGGGPTLPQPQAQSQSQVGAAGNIGSQQPVQRMPQQQPSATAQFPQQQQTTMGGPMASSPHQLDQAQYPPSSHVQQHHLQQQSHPHHGQPTSYPTQHHQPSLQPHLQNPLQPGPPISPDHPTQPLPAVTPHMWQDVFTNAYVSGHGLKRYREEDLPSQQQQSQSQSQSGTGYEGIGGYGNVKRRG